MKEGIENYKDIKRGFGKLKNKIKSLEKCRKRRLGKAQKDKVWTFEKKKYLGQKKAEGSRVSKVFCLKGCFSKGDISSDQHFPNFSGRDPKSLNLG